MSRALINTDLIAERRLALNMSPRALHRAAALSHRVVYVTEPGSMAHASMTLAELTRLAAALGVPPADLLTTSSTDTTGPPTDDVGVLLAALMDEAKVALAHKEDVARALGWPLERIDTAAREAAARLPALGLQLHENHGAVAVRAAHGLLTGEEQQRVARAKTLRSHLRIDHASALHDIAHGGVPADWYKGLSAKRSIAFQGLRKRGLIEEVPAGGLQLTATAAYSLLLTDEPPAEREPRTATESKLYVGDRNRPPRRERRPRRQASDGDAKIDPAASERPPSPARRPTDAT